MAGRIIETIDSLGKTHLSNVLDVTNGHSLEYTEVSEYADGSPIDDAKTLSSSGVYRKYNDKYFIQSLDLEKSRTLTVSTVSSLRSISVKNLILIKIGYYDKVTTKGYYNEGDGGGSDYLIKNSTSSTDDGFLIIKPNNGLGLEFTPIIQSEVNVKIGGVKADGVSDDWVSFSLILSKFQGLITFKGKVLLSDTLQIPSNTNIVGDGIDSSVLYYKDYSAKSGAFENYLIDINERVNVGIRNCTVDLGVQTAADTRTSGIQLRGVSKSINIENVKVKNAKLFNPFVFSGGYAIVSWHGGADDVTLSNLQFDNNGQSDLGIFEGQDWNVHTIKCKNTGYMPVNIESALGSRFIKRINVNGVEADTCGYALISVIRNISNTGAVEDVIVQNVIGKNVAQRVGGSSGGIRVRGTENTTISNVIIIGCKQIPLSVTVDSGYDVNNLTLRNITIKGVEGNSAIYAVNFAGSLTNGINNLEVDGLKVYDAPSLGIFADCLNNFTGNNISLINGLGTRSFELRRSKIVKINNSTLKGSTGVGLNIQDSQYVTVSNTDVLNNATRGIQIFGTSDHIKLNSVNSFDDRTTRVQGFGLFLETTTTSPYVVINGGDFTGNVTRGIGYASAIDLNNVVMLGNNGDAVINSPKRTVTANSILSLTDRTVYANNTGDLIITLPLAILFSGKKYYIKKISNNTDPVFIYGAGTELIDTANIYAIRSPGAAVVLQSDGVKWNVLSSMQDATTTIRGGILKAAAITGTSPTSVVKTSPVASSVYAQADIQKMVDDITNLTSQLNNVTTQFNSLKANMITSGQLT